MLFLLCLATTALGLAPVTTPTVTRRETFGAAAGLVALIQTPAFADEEAPVVEAPPAEVEFPKDWGLTSDYYTDAAKVVNHMRIATNLDKGAPNIELIAQNTKKEMSEFVAFYRYLLFFSPSLPLRRFTNVAGKQSFSTLYTAINVLAGHYTSYGPKIPVPAKRRTRLMQEYAEVEKNIKRRR